MESEVDPYAEQRYRDGLDCATKATQYDQMGQYSCALTFYSEAVEALTQASQMAPLFSPILSRVEEYGRRAEELRVSLNSGSEYVQLYVTVTHTHVHIYTYVYIYIFIMYIYIMYTHNVTAAYEKQI